MMVLDHKGEVGWKITMIKKREEWTKKEERVTAIDKESFDQGMMILFLNVIIDTKRLNKSSKNKFRID